MARGVALLMLGFLAPASAFQPPCRSPTQSSESRWVSGRMPSAQRVSAARQYGGRLSMKRCQRDSDRAAWGVVLGKGLQKLGPLAGLIFGIRPWMGPAVHAEETATTKTLEASATKSDASDDLFEEVWKLTGKFYFDRSFGGHDWDKAHDELRPRAKATDEGSEVRTTKKLLKLLGDKYTQLVSQSMYTELSRFDPIGAGFMLSLDDDGYFTVSSDPREGSEAAKLHVEKGDRVLEIEGVVVKGKSVFDAIDLITKDDKDDVRLTIQSHKDASTRPLVLPREFKSVSDPVTYSLVNAGGQAGRPVGYIRLKEFNSLAKTKIQDAILAMEKQGAEAYVLDLRGNPGGSVQSAVGVAGLLLDENSVVTYIQDATGKKLPLKTQGPVALKDEPLVVWTDKRSASASEILASALHDNCRAALMGQRTFGKGLVQGVFGLSDGRGLIMTVASYETPNGASIQGKGIAPDIEMKIPGLSILGATPDLSIVDGKAYGFYSDRSGKMCAAPMSTEI